MPQTKSGDTPRSGKLKECILKKWETTETVLLDHVKNDKRRHQWVADQFKTLQAGVTKFGKKDYLNLVYNAVIGMAITIVVPPDTGIQIIQMLHELLSHAPQLLG